MTYNEKICVLMKTYKDKNYYDALKKTLDLIFDVPEHHPDKEKLLKIHDKLLIKCLLS